jgi:ring-1,2-phenylacetyl-CoA epoxidase subunit PaaE
MSDSSPRARPSALDLLAATVARVTPAAVHPALEALRRVRPAGDGEPVPLDQVRVLATILPRPVAERVDALRRDVRAVTRSLRGEPPVVVTTLRPAPAPQADAPASTVSRTVEPRAVRVVSVHEETADARSFVLEDPRGGTLSFVPGQFVTVLVTIDGVTHRRAYSISSGTDELPRVRLTVKRVAQGVVSNHLNEHVRAGDTLDLLGPSGAFTLDEAAAGTPDRALPEHLWMFAGGSGITPVYALARAALAANPWTRVTLVYANRSASSVIFREDLAALAREHGARFALRSVLEHAEPDAPDAPFVGRLDRAMASRVCDELALPADALCFVCGPEPMMDAVREVLVDRGVDRARIREERFSAPQRRGEPGEKLLGGHALTIRHRGRAVTVQTAPGQTVLEAGLAAGIDMPFSCTMGGCGACKLTLARGAVEMQEPNCLTDRERADGAILACVGCTRADAVVEVP